MINIDINKLRNRLLLDISIAGQRFLQQPVDKDTLIYLQKDIIQNELVRNYQKMHYMI